ncbi:MAG: flagellar biosynthesis regulator FlaF [Alphaproteobacteria bacterium]|nr:flagellar biosynthesis regulator FlaF [Alphaproteobacteria bacterium]
MNKTVASAYSSHQRGEESLRETEAHALLSCASRLEAARQDSATEDALFDALRHNQQLWTLFQACLCEKDNPLPLDLKQLLLNISCYIDKTTFRAMSTNDKTLLSSLIALNRTIAAGLSKKPEDQPPMPPPVGGDMPSVTTSV